MGCCGLVRAGAEGWWHPWTPIRVSVSCLLGRARGAWKNQENSVQTCCEDVDLFLGSEYPGCRRQGCFVVVGVAASLEAGKSGQGQGRGCKNSSRVSWPAKPKRQDQNAAVSLRRTSGHDPLTSLPPFPSALLPCLAFYKSQTPWTIYLPIAWRADCRARSIVRYLAAIVSPKHRPSLTAPRDQHCAARPPFTTRCCTS